MKPLQRFETNAGRVIYSFPVRSFPTLTNNIYVIDDGQQYVESFLVLRHYEEMGTTDYTDYTD